MVQEHEECSKSDLAVDFKHCTCPQTVVIGMLLAHAALTVNSLCFPIRVSAYPDDRQR